MTKTPIIIPSRNGERHIERTLDSLPRSVSPLVITNGERDDTEIIAKHYGAETRHADLEGKMIAIQEGLHTLGRQALSSLIVLDVDTTPCFPEKWHSGYRKKLETPGPNPRIVGGPVIFKDADIATCALRTTRRAQLALGSPKEITALNSRGRLVGHQFGPHMGINLKNNSELLDAILAMPNYWPGEDEAIGKMIVASSGSYEETLNPTMLATTPLSTSFASWKESIRHRLSGGTAIEQGNEMWRRYEQVGPANSTPFPDLTLPQ